MGGFLTIALGIGLIYTIWILLFSAGWRRLKSLKINSGDPDSFSLVVAVRNEAQNLPGLLKSLSQLKYPAELFEVIIIDDHSTDNTIQIVEKLKSGLPFSLVFKPQEKQNRGKKKALELGYQLANNNLIVTTDADCIIPPNWLKLFNESFRNSKLKMCTGGVRFSETKGFLGKFQWLELTSLVGSGASAISLRQPIMCNGANLAFRKNLLNNLEDSTLNHHFSSGDDTFLLMWIKQKFGAQAIGFIKNPEHYVTTSPEKTWKSYTNQRIRWVSKSSGYRDVFLIATSLLVLLENLMLLILLPLSILHLKILILFLILFLSKLTVDFAFLYLTSEAEERKKWVGYYVLLAMFYPLFISYTAVWGQFKGFEWKGRFYEK
jgi:cellulose synthase/poly-beta-1,6-N-acetylglucosamine synthase-like glycosyltransferase